MARVAPTRANQAMRVSNSMTNTRNRIWPILTKAFSDIGCLSGAGLVCIVG